jgi:gluconate 2-dehydrogenase gamma chain
MVIDRREALRQAALLLGGTLSAPAIAGVLAGCDAATVWASEAPPRAFTAAQLELVAVIAEHIIPTTDTPGARAAGVHRFIDTMMAEYYPATDRQRFLDGLADVDDRSARANGRRFVSATKAQQRAILAGLDLEAFPTKTTVANDASKDTERGGGGMAASAEAKTSAKPPHFFRTMKELTVLGYYTSQIGATKELRYVQVPGRFSGCVPFKSIGRTWAV